MANLIRSLIENDKKELKRLDSIAKKVESYADQMDNYKQKLLNSRADTKKEKH